MPTTCSDTEDNGYKDYSEVPDYGFENGNRGISRSSRKNFPVRLHYLLSRIEKDGFGHIVSWQPHGRCFLIRNQKKFVETVLPNWYDQSQFTSFQRQLNLYGFGRITRGPDKNAYYHEKFLRGKPFLTEQIPRQKIKGKGARKPADPAKEPNFYSMPELPDPSKPQMLGPPSKQVYGVPPRYPVSGGLGPFADVASLMPWQLTTVPCNSIVPTNPQLPHQSLASNMFFGSGYPLNHIDLPAAYPYNLDWQQQLPFNGFEGQRLYDHPRTAAFDLNWVGNQSMARLPPQELKTAFAPPSIARPPVVGVDGRLLTPELQREHAEVLDSKRIHEG